MLQVDWEAGNYNPALKKFYAAYHEFKEYFISVCTLLGTRVNDTGIWLPWYEPDQANLNDLSLEAPFKDVGTQLQLNSVQVTVISHLVVCTTLSWA